MSFNRVRFPGCSEVNFFAIFSESADSEGNKFKTFNAIFPKEKTSDALLKNLKKSYQVFFFFFFFFFISLYKVVQESLSPWN